MGSIDTPRSFRRSPVRRLLPVVAAVGLLLTLGWLTAACGNGDDTTTTVVTAGPTTTSGVPGETTTTGASGDTTTTMAVEETTTTAIEETTTTLPEETTTTEKLSTAEERLANGNIKAMGFIKKVWTEGGKRYISIDYAQLLTGEEAIKAAIKAGYINPGDSLDNDYFITNTNKDLRQFQVAGDAPIKTSTYQGQQDNPITWTQFASIWSAAPADQEIAYLADSPWWIERDGATIVKVDEQYLP